MEVGYCFVIKFCIFLFSLIFLLLSLQLNHPSSLQRKKEYLNEQVVFTPCQFFGVENFSIGTLMEYSLIKQLYMIWCFILHDDCVYLPFFQNQSLHENVLCWKHHHKHIHDESIMSVPIGKAIAILYLLLSNGLPIKHSTMYSIHVSYMMKDNSLCQSLIQKLKIQFSSILHEWVLWNVFHVWRNFTIHRVLLLDVKIIYMKKILVFVLNFYSRSYCLT